MRKGFLILACFFWFITTACSQSVIKGIVTNAVTGDPIGRCSVFISNTSIGATTDEAGKFVLTNVPQGKFELVISSVGYETYVHSFSATELPLDLIVQLKQKVTELQGVTVEPFIKNGWEIWGKTFTQVLIGTTDFAVRCTIKNQEAVRFRFSQKRNELTAIADEPLIIENLALGYVLKYALEEFTVNFNNQTSLYLGYPLFIEMPSRSKAWDSEWKDNRQKAYSGSVMNFIRSIYNDEINAPVEHDQQGFEIHKQLKLPNSEKSRVKAIITQQKEIGLPADSIRYFKKTMRQPDSLTTERILTAKDLVTIQPDQSKSFFFTDKLSIIYRRKRKLNTDVQKSSIFLTTPEPVQIEANGSYDPPLEIFSLGYWAQSEKLANLLPLNYWPDDE